jgi:hypothetical protein
VETVYYKLKYIIPQGKKDIVAPVHKYSAIKMYGGVEIKLHAFPLALDGGEWSASHFSHITHPERTPLLFYIILDV